MLERLEPLIREAMAQERVPGLAIALVRDGEIVDARGFGLADPDAGTAATAHTTFGAASITKPVLATGLMRHVEAGRLDLDAPVDALLAPIELENPFAEPVTLRRLLTHTAGLPVGNLPGDGGAKSLAESVAAGARVAEPPGGRIVYANWGYDILALLLGVVAGRPWHREVEHEVLAPLGMARSSFGTVPEARGGYVSAVDGELHPALQDVAPWDPPTGAGSLVASVEDLARFLLLHVSGGGDVLSADALAEMHRTSAPAGSSGGGMGLGFRTDRLAGRALICHGGDGIGTTNLVAALPGQGVAVALLMNLNGAQTARTRLATEALRALLDEEPPAPKRVDPSADWSGRYRSGFWDIDVVVEDTGGSLSVRSEGGLVLGPFESVAELDPLGGDRFRARGGMFHGLELCFEDGDPPRFHGGVYPYTFTRTGPAAPLAPIDEAGDLRGSWAGPCESPLGTLPAQLTVEGESSARTTLLTLRDAAVASFRAERGRVEGELALELQPFGELTLFLRLVLRAGVLEGPVYVRGSFGELPMPTRLERA